ncbi:hypothetical protein AgCh_017595 [Apium graveolens]
MRAETSPKNSGKMGNEAEVKKEYETLLFKDYDCSIQYHPGKDNVVADALSRKEKLSMITLPKELSDEVEKLQLELCEHGGAEEMCCSITFQPTLLKRIKKCHDEVMTQENQEKRYVHKKTNKVINFRFIFYFVRFIKDDEVDVKEIAAHLKNDFLRCFRKVDMEVVGVHAGDWHKANAEEHITEPVASDVVGSAAIVAVICSTHI